MHVEMEARIAEPKISEEQHSGWFLASRNPPGRKAPALLLLPLSCFSAPLTTFGSSVIIPYLPTCPVARQSTDRYLSAFTGHHAPACPPSGLDVGAIEARDGREGEHSRDRGRPSIGRSQGSCPGHLVLASCPPSTDLFSSYFFRLLFGMGFPRRPAFC